MTDPRFKIGDEVWRATWDSTPNTVTCPECGGQGRIRCLLHDDTMVSVECQGCRHGYEPANGRINVYDRRPVAKIGCVSGLEITRDRGIKYRVADLSHTWIVDDADIFATQAEAEARASVMAADADKEERERINRKEKDTRSWSWHVHYHRREIREAQRRIEYHTAKLAVARVKAKEPQEAAAP